MFAAELLLLPTGLVTAGFLTRQLGAEAYGLFTLTATIVGWLQWIVNAIVARSGQRMVARTEHWRPVAAEVVRLQFGIGAVLGGVLLLGAPHLAKALEQPLLTTPLRILSLDLPLYALACGYRNVLIGTIAHRAWALGIAARWLSRMLAILLFIQAGMGITGAVLGLLCSSASELLVARWSVGPLPRAGAEEVVAIRRALGAFIAPVALGTMAMRTFDRADLLMLSMSGVGATALGHYGAAQNLAVVVALASSSAAPAVFASVVGHRRAGDEEGARQIAMDALRLPFLALPFLALAAGSATEIVTMIYGQAFAPAAMPFLVLILAGSALMTISMATGLLVADGRPWWVMYISLPMVGVLVLLSSLLIPRFGATGAALASLVAASGGAVVAMGVTVRALKMPVPVRSMVLSVVTAGIVFAGARSTPATSSALTVIKLAAGSALLAAALVASGEIRLQALRSVWWDRFERSP